MTAGNKISAVFLSFFLGFIFFASPARPENPPRINVQLISDVAKVNSGDTFKIGVHIQIERGWHIYWKKSGDAGLPTHINLDIPPGLKVSEWRWPKPAIFKEEGNITTIGYENEVLLIANAALSPRWPTGKPVLLKGNVDYLACRESCIPGKAPLEISIPVEKVRAVNTAGAILIQQFSPLLLSSSEENTVLGEYQKMKSQGDFLSLIGSAGAREGLTFGWALLFAFLGGLLLNIMPCVLPVLSIKAVRLLRQADVSRKENWRQSFFYLLGILASFSALGLVVAGLKLAGKEIGWGFQFQEPRFLVFMIAVVFTFGLSLLGFYEFSFAVPQNVEKITRKESWVGPFGEGLLATILATPCTAPFLGPAIGFSFSQKPLLIFIFFWLIGLGLASPYLILAAYPAWGRIMPKPGRWMDTFKKFMAFPLFGTGIWLFWILSRQVINQALVGTLLVLLIIGFGLWAMTEWGDINHPPWKRRLVGFITFLLIIWAYFQFVAPFLTSKPALNPNNQTAGSAEEGGIEWKPFTLTMLQKSLEEKKLVFVDFSADWCLTCQFNEKTVLSSPKVAEAFNNYGVLAMKADWTDRNEEISGVLRKLGRAGVPVYVFFKNGDASNPIILPEVLTEKLLLDKLNQITKPT